MEWISVKDKLPENKKDVLVITFEDGPYFYHIAQLFYDTWATHSEVLHYVTHWMQLPGPPKH